MIIICFSSSASEQSRTTILQKSCPRDKFVVCSRIADVDRLERNKTKCDIHWKSFEGDNIRCDNERIVRIRNGWLAGRLFRRTKDYSRNNNCAPKQKLRLVGCFN